jgi:hypothetical protein
MQGKNCAGLKTEALKSASRLSVQGQGLREPEILRDYRAAR